MDTAKPSQVDHPDRTTVLIADDDPITRELLKHFLDGRGHTILLAADGEEAWNLFLAHRPRLVITDWRMPKLDGLQLCSRIRDHKHEEYTFVIILTSTEDHEAMCQGFAAGADDFMTKPFDRVEFDWRIHSGLRVIGLHAALENRIGQLDEAREKLELTNREMRQGLSAAADTQRALLPTAAPDVRNVKSAWFYEPSDHLGGDSLNLFRLTDEKLGFFIVDVCGHGLPAALLAVSLHRVMTPVLGHAGLLADDEQGDPLDLFCDPGRVLTEVNRRFPMKIENGEYFTSVYGVIDTKQSKLHFAGAGHPHPLLLSETGPTERLETAGFPIGFDSHTEYETKVVDLHPGDRLYVFSDGVVECKNADGDMFGFERLIESLERKRSQPVSDVVKQMADSRAEWEQGQDDDITMILLEFCGSSAKGGEPLSVTAEAT